MTAFLDNKVLVLNRSWLPINVATVRDAVTLVYTQAAEFVHPTSYEAFGFESWKDAAEFARDVTRYLHGCGWKMPVPEVIVLSDYNGQSLRNVKFSRRRSMRAGQRDRLGPHDLARQAR